MKLDSSLRGLRGIPEDLISLRFIRKLKRADRHEVIKARMMITVAAVVERLI